MIEIPYFEFSDQSPLLTLVLAGWPKGGGGGGVALS